MAETTPINEARGTGSRALFRGTLLALALPLALTACGESEPAPSANEPVPESELPPEPDTGDYPIGDPVTGIEAESCNALKAEQFVDREATDEVRAELEGAVAPVEDIRYVGPGDATTEDLRPRRLNVMIDNIGEIRSVHCG